MRKYFFGVSFFLIFATTNALACASGCSISNVATSSIFPNDEGGIAFLQYDYLSQTRNWNKHKPTNGHNHDKRIETQTVTAGAQYMFNREFGAAIRVPYVTRQVINQPHHGSPTYNRNSDIGDIRVSGIYSGFFDDMSSGLIYGLKLPTGQTNAKNFNRNTQIGTGSFDSILGFYHKNSFGKSAAGYFVQGNWERPFTSHQGFTAGYEISGAVGAYYSLGQFNSIKSVTPILQITSAKKSQDHGYADPSHNANSGYNFFYFNPGLEIAVGQYKIYADFGMPIYRSTKGNQLVPQNAYKLILGYNF